MNKETPIKRSILISQITSSSMLILVVASSIFALANAIECPYCTAKGVYTDQATACDNIQKDSTCKLLYGASDVEAGGSEERPVNCFNGTNGLDADVIDLATSTCPKTCGFCCRTPAYKCEDKPLAQQSPFLCAKVTKAQCQDPTLKPYLADSCPATCGLCQYGDCVDDPVVDCASQPGICLTMPDFAKDHCKRTCGYCTVSGATTKKPTQGTDQCKDSTNNCADWKSKGFCTSDKYPLADRMKYCGVTCGFC